MDKEFQKYATKGLGLSSMTLDRYRTATDAYINPTIIEERKLNVASMDVFSRLMMDRIIFLGVPIDDDVANIIQAQLLFLASTDSSADISLYINTPGGQVTSGLAIYDTMQLVEPDVATICTAGTEHHAPTCRRTCNALPCLNSSSVALFGFLCEDLIHHSVLQSLLSCHPVVPVSVGEHFLVRLSGMLGDDVVQFLAGLLDLLGGDHDVGRLSLGAAQRLMDQHP